MPQPNCTVCTQPVADGEAYVALIEDWETMNREKGFWYKWVHGCIHHQHDPKHLVIVLGSVNCANEWLREHPSYMDSYLEFILGKEDHSVDTTNPSPDT